MRLGRSIPGPGWLAFALLSTLGLSGRAEAQAPGPMSKGHEHLAGLTDCEKCHEGGTGVPDKKCLGCHDHRDLRQQIEAGKGFHASKEVKKDKCKDCHAEHIEQPVGSGKGRKTTVDWRPFGGMRNFEHQLTGWPLQGAHRFQKCEQCHDKKSKRTGLTVFLGLRGECTSCHKNPHEFTDVRLSDCTICHGFENRKVKSLGATKFDHDKTKYPLLGLHKQEECTSCHKDTVKFTITDRDWKDCKGCHQDSHKSVISAKHECSKCHKNDVKFERTKWDHAANTRFPLRGQHAKNKCSDCHKVGSKPEAPTMKCEGCHEDIHKGRFTPEPCEGCHTETGWKKSLVYDHDKKTKFALTGQHKTADCQACHRGGLAAGFERFEKTDCASCHKHQDAHCGQFGLENCERCHVQGGDKTSRFDHNATRFALEGAHLAQNCERCHRPEKLGSSGACAVAVKYTGLDPSCAACHEDIHAGTLGTDCAKCHTGGRDFETLAFDHNRDARFPLTGFHQLVACESCHPARRYKLGDIRCESCHLEDDAHAGRLGDDCGKCHETSGGAPKFDHDVHTAFTLDGVHERIECQRCHYLPPPEQRSGISAMEASGRPLDLQYRASGKDCVSCHPDPHLVRPLVSAVASSVPLQPLDCGACHSFDRWEHPPKNGYHERVGFALEGSHTVLACSLCHSGPVSMAGRGEQCGTCHTADDVHAGSFGNDCGRCHEQISWLPSSFTHNDVGYVLQGIHRMLDCRQCHLGGNYFVGRECWNCHLQDFRASIWHESDLPDPNGNRRVGSYLGDPPPASFDCGECHNQFDFNVSTYYQPKSQRGQ